MSKTIGSALVKAALFAAFVTPGTAEDLRISDKMAGEILDELKQIRKLLENQPKFQGQQAPFQAKTAKFEVAGAPFLGSKDAPITIVEFTGFQCLAFVVATAVVKIPPLAVAARSDIILPGAPS